MHMMLMLGILTFIFFTTLFLMCIYRFKLNTKIWNTVFIVADVVCYFLWTYSYHLNDILGDKWLTLTNISPLMFTVIPLTLFMKDRLKMHAYSALAFLSLGMFIAMLISPEHDYLFNFRNDATFIMTTESVCHLICSLFGIYLVLSEQVEVSVKSLLRSMVFMYTFILFGVAMNFIFHRNYFGMDPYGNYTIYMIDIFRSFEATLIAYLFGVALTLIGGFQLVYILDRITKKHIPRDNKVADREIDSKEL